MGQLMDQHGQGTVFHLLLPNRSFYRLTKLNVLFLQPHQFQLQLLTEFDRLEHLGLEAILNNAPDLLGQKTVANIVDIELLLHLLHFVWSAFVDLAGVLSLLRRLFTSWWPKLNLIVMVLSSSDCDHIFPLLLFIAFLLEHTVGEIVVIVHGGGIVRVITTSTFFFQGSATHHVQSCQICLI